LLLLLLELLLLLLLLRALVGLLRAGAAERQVAQEREPDARHLEVTSGERAIRLRLLEENARLRELDLRGDALAIPDFGDRVGTRRLLRRAGARFPRRFGLGQRGERGACVEGGELGGLLEPQSRLIEVGARDELVAADATAGEDRNAQPG
jgi:hypothetical protein